MRGAAAAAAAVFVMGAAAPALPAPESLCTLDDRRLVELSGLVAPDGEVWAVADGGRAVAVHRLDPDTCEITTTRDADIDPYDVEDLASGPDGEFWVGDIGDNERRRDTIAVIVLPARGSARLHRLTYPDGPHDAEALLVDPQGRPIIITKEFGAAAGVYRTDMAPPDTGPTPLRRVGEVSLPSSDTVGGPLGGFGTRTVTGAGSSPDGTLVALRTYTDAWLFRVPSADAAAPDAGGDPAAALTTSAGPTRVPLPDEPQGEAVALTGEGALLSASERRGGVPGRLRRVEQAALMAAEAATATAEPDRAAPVSEQDEATGAPAPIEQAAPSADRLAAVGGVVTVVVLGLLAAVLSLRARLRRR